MDAPADEFRLFLAQRMGVALEDLPSRGETDGTGNTIGALCLRMGLLDLGQIDEILDDQRASLARFGEIAIDKGLLTAGQVARILDLQAFSRNLEYGGRLLIAGRVDLARLATWMGEFAAGG